MAVLPRPAARPVRRPDATLSTRAPRPRVEVRLLGRPSITIEGRDRPLAGRKPWALLGILALEGRPLGRSELAERIWPDADDPRAALRWALVQVRRALGGDVLVDDRSRGLGLLSGPEVAIDAVDLLAGRLDLGEVERTVGPELLEGFWFDGADLDRWLALERSRVRSASAEALRWAATLRLTSDPAASLRLAERAARHDPYDDAVHELIVEAHLRAGDLLGARAYVDGVRTLYAADLGLEPPASLADALQRPSAGDAAIEVGAATEAPARLELAAARLRAGDYEAAARLAREAVAAAAATDDSALEARASLDLATILIHSVRGRDRETQGLLRRTLGLATEAGNLRLAAEAERETGYLHFLDADYGAAELALERSAHLAEAAGDRRLLGQALTIEGAARSDRADFVGARATLERAIAALAGLDERWVAYATSFVARLELRTGEPGPAITHATAAVAGARSTGWTSVVPWPLSILGEAQLASGDVEAARATFEEALVLAREIGDPCWEAVALRGIALIARHDGDLERAEDLLVRALGCSRRLPDSYDWAEAVVLTDLVELQRGRALEHLEAARRLVERGPMPDLAERLAAVAPQPAARHRPDTTRVQTLSQPVAS